MNMDILDNDLVRFLEDILAPIDIPRSTWSEFWPNNVAISDIDQVVKDLPMMQLSKFMAAAVFYCILFGVARWLCQIFLFQPLAIYAMQLQDAMDIKRLPTIDKGLPPPKKKGETISAQEVEDFCDKKKMNKTAVNEYLWKRRRHIIATSKISKFNESLWRDVLYTAFTIIGFYTLFVPGTAPWILDTKEFWINWPLQDNSILLLYYQLELGCYLHMLMWTEVHRSDAAEMIAHHLITITLITFSYEFNFMRIGSSILLLHDIADIFLESAKCIHYASKVKKFAWLAVPCDILFGIFAVSFFLTRLVYYPYYVIGSTMTELCQVVDMSYKGWYVMIYGFLAFKWALFGLHCFWFSLIFKMVVRQLQGIRPEKDERSDDEEVMEEEEGEKRRMKEEEEEGEKRSMKEGLLPLVDDDKMKKKQ